MRKHLNICIEVEETVARIYRVIAESPLLTVAVRNVMHELAQDEDDHASQLRFALRFQDGAVVKSLPEMLQQAEKMLKKAQAALDKVSGMKVNDQQAVSIGIELENHFCQVHIANSFDFKEDNYKNMFAAMAKEDDRHCKRLKELQEELRQK